MAVLLPYIGVPSNTRAELLLKNYPSSIVGTFWVMNGYGFDEPDHPGWWTDIVLEKNQAQTILDSYENGYFKGQHNNPLYLGFCIIVVGDKGNPANVSFVIQHVRMAEFEGVKLLTILAQHNIPAHTEVTYPKQFLERRYGYRDDDIPEHLKDIHHWDVQTWEDYCHFLLSVNGERMLERYWSNNSP